MYENPMEEPEDGAPSRHLLGRTFRIGRRRISFKVEWAPDLKWTFRIPLRSAPGAKLREFVSIHAIDPGIAGMSPFYNLVLGPLMVGGYVDLKP